MIAMFSLAQNPANNGAPANDSRKQVKDIAMKLESLYRPFKWFMLKSLSTLGRQFRQMNNPIFEKI